jgi:uncharacterized membrane protein YqjE
MATTFSRAAPQPSQPSLASRVTTLARDTGNLVRDHLELAALEAQRAAISIAKVLSAAVIVSLLVITAWLTFVTSAIVWSTDKGVSWPAALIVAGVLNLVVAAGAVFWIRSQLGDWAFPATRRQFKRTTEEATEEE